MLSAGAYSFRQKSRLAISLSWVGGYIDVVALIGIGTVVSHVTGTSTQFGRSIGNRDGHAAFFFAFLLITFTFGAALSGLLTEIPKRLVWHSKYVLPIGLEALLLAILTCLLESVASPPTGTMMFLAAGVGSIAMGLQNATVTKISGAIVRTTHLTGIFTDFGLEGVQFLFWWGDKLGKMRRERAGRLLKISRNHPTTLRLLLLLSIAGSFGFGTVIGTIAFSRLGAAALVVPIAFLLWIVYTDLRMPIADVRELDLLNDPELRLQGLISKLLPPEVVLYRASYARGGAAHRAPDFQLWLDRVPERCRIVILAMSPLTRFNANAVLDLQAAIERLHCERKKLILAGVTPHQFKILDDLGATRTMDVNNICPDLEFAIARAIGILEEMRSPPSSLAGASG
jgi:uncharacterized membrane protein YoaK (UPF0700 family)